MATVDGVNKPPPPRSVLELSVFGLPGSNDALENEKEIRSYDKKITPSSKLICTHSTSSRKFLFIIIFCGLFNKAFSNETI
jgi:hypothetical protein